VAPEEELVGASSSSTRLSLSFSSGQEQREDADE
jgi:hypothetical protein